MDKETLSNYGWIVVLVLILAVMLALASPFGSFVSTAIKDVTGGFWDVNSTALNSAGVLTDDVSFDEEMQKGENEWTVPDDGTYTTVNGAVYNAGDVIPKDYQIQEGDTYVDSDYIYKYKYYFTVTWTSTWELNSAQTGWGVRVKNIEKNTYGVILNQINNEPVTTLQYTFWNCSKLTSSPTIPNGITNMKSTFANCSSLITAPEIPDSVINVSNTFSGCGELKNVPAIPDSVINMAGTFQNCKSLITSPEISNNVSDLSSAFEGCSNLITPPDLSGCTKLNSLYQTFANCQNLTGYITINANPTEYSGCFQNVDIKGQNITLVGSSQLLEEIKSTGYNY